jgi:gas vesicle protein
VGHDHEQGGYSGGAVAFALLVGAVIGAGAALLLAPQTGAQTRALLRDYAEKAEDEVRERMGEVREKMKEAKTTLDTAIEQGKQFLTDKGSILSAAYEAGREAIKKERPR